MLSYVNIVLVISFWIVWEDIFLFNNGLNFRYNYRINIKKVWEGDLDLINENRNFMYDRYKYFFFLIFLYE